MSGKGSAPRPYSVGQDEYASNWDRIFSGSGVIGSAAVSNTAGSGSAPDSPANAEANDCGFVRADGAVTRWDAALGQHVVIAPKGTFLRPLPIYIDDESGSVVPETWWPGDPAP